MGHYDGVQTLWGWGMWWSRRGSPATTAHSDAGARSLDLELSGHFKSWHLAADATQACIAARSQVHGTAVRQPAFGVGPRGCLTQAQSLRWRTVKALPAHRSARTVVTRHREGSASEACVVPSVFRFHGETTGRARGRSATKRKRADGSELGRDRQHRCSRGCRCQVVVRISAQNVLFIEDVGEVDLRREIVGELEEQRGIDSREGW